MPYAIAILLGLGLEHPVIAGVLVFAVLGGWYYDHYVAPRIRYGDVSPPDMTPTDYERFCAQVLEENGWTCTLTPVSGDHGVDIVAQKNGRILAIQTKRWSRPVNNKAVQEVVAGMAMYGATEAAVVSTAAYKKSALQLAAVNGVALLHHSDLAKL